VEKLATMYIYDEYGKASSVKELWTTSTVLIVFIRHFGCVSCRAHVKQVLEHRETNRAHYEKNRVRVVFIGNGAPAMIKVFKEELHIPDAEIYTDPLLTSFRACGFRRGFKRMISFESARNVVGLVKQGFRQALPHPDHGVHQQLGGVVVVKPGSVVTYHFISESIGDFPLQEEALQTVGELRRSA
jgi:hypothetical protein